jgi:methyltransferase (TIGR00027 family)
MEFLVARARYMDDFLQIYLDDGLEQLVILGAGFDSRAYRFEKLKGQVKVFEVDHPATQQVKLEKLKKIFKQLPDHIVYVPVDFNEETLEKRLYESGYDKGLKTLFIWEGVTPYLTPEAIDDTLAFIAHNSGRGSAVIFDYVYTWLLQEASKHGEIKRMQRYRGFTGEGLTFGIEQGTIEAIMKPRGFYQVKNMDSQDLRSLYFIGVNQKRMIASGYAIVSAVVKSKGYN